jgi:DNA-binding response OmpR family regulator
VNVQERVTYLPSVLVVEDDHDLRGLLVTLLTDEGYAVVAAEDGERALQLCAEREPDLVVLDLQLPRFGGLEFLRRHRSSHQCAGKVIALTAGRVTEDDLVAHGVDALISKPFDIDELLARIRQILASGVPLHADRA